MEPGHDDVAEPSDLVVPLGQKTEYFTVVAGSTGRSPRERRAAMATDSASLGSFLFERPVPSTRTLEASVAGTSRTSSPAFTSCWDGADGGHIENYPVWTSERYEWTKRLPRSLNQAPRGVWITSDWKDRAGV